jgi:casein kinase 1
MITLVQNVHEKNLIYRDIKPDNFLISHPNSKRPNQVFMVDFGMAKFYRDPKTKMHIPYREKKSLSGTARYMSINTHLGREQSRRDDLEALGHVFMYFIRGSLPWQGLKAATNKQKYEKIGEKKQTTPINELCQSHPKEFGIYLKKVRGLAFEETPDYDGYRQLFTQVLVDLNIPDDGVYDWMVGNSPSPPNLKINALPAKHPINTEPLTPGGRSNEANSQLVSMLPHLGNSTHHLRPSLQTPRTPEYPQQTHTNTTSTTLQPVPPVMSTDPSMSHSMGKPSSPHRLSEHARDYSPHALRNQHARADTGQNESSVQKVVSFFTCRACS